MMKNGLDDCYSNTTQSISKTSGCKLLSPEERLNHLKNPLCSSYFNYSDHPHFSLIAVSHPRDTCYLLVQILHQQIGARRRALVIYLSFSFFPIL